MSFEIKKIDLVRFILSIDNEHIIDEIKNQIIHLYANGNDTTLSKYTAKLEETTNLDKIMKEQNFKGIDPVKMEMLSKKAAIQEPLEDLLNMLG